MSALRVTKPQRTSCFRDVVIGWDVFEPVVVGCAAAGLDLIVLGKHGIGKTKTGKLIASSFGEDKFRYYDVAKADIIAVAGIPSVEALKAGEYKFAGHNYSIWKAKVVVADELSRAPKANQNMWLEILQERTLNGEPLELHTLIATMNPDDYEGTVKVDPALLDRFAVVIPIDDPADQGDVNVNVPRVIRADVHPDALQIQDKATKRLTDVMAEVQRLSSEIYDHEVFEAIEKYCSTVFSMLMSKENVKKDETPPYISWRRAPLFTRVLVAVACYHKIYGRSNWLERGADAALKYALCRSVGVPWEVASKAHNKAKQALVKAQKHLTLSEVDSVLLDYNQIADFSKKLAFLQEKQPQIEKWQPVERQKILHQFFTNARDRRNGPAILGLYQLLNNGFPGDNNTKEEVGGWLALRLSEKFAEQTITPTTPADAINVANRHHEILVGNDPTYVIDSSRIS